MYWGILWVIIRLKPWTLGKAVLRFLGKLAPGFFFISRVSGVLLDLRGIANLKGVRVNQMD